MKLCILCSHLIEQEDIIKIFVNALNLTWSYNRNFKITQNATSLSKCEDKYFFSFLILSTRFENSSSPVFLMMGAFFYTEKSSSAHNSGSSVLYHQVLVRTIKLSLPESSVNLRAVPVTVALQTAQLCKYIKQCLRRLRTTAMFVHCTFQGNAQEYSRLLAYLLTYT